MKKLLFLFWALLSGHFGFACMTSDHNLCSLAKEVNLIPGLDSCEQGCTSDAPSGVFDRDTRGCEASPFGTIWYTITPFSDDRYIDLKLTSSEMTYPMLSVYQGDCNRLTAIDCNQNNSGVAKLLNVKLEADVTYYIAVSSVNGIEGQFEICFNTSNTKNVCNLSNKIEVLSTSKGSPLYGPYQPDETVEICYSIDVFERDACNFLQGIVPMFGNGWSDDSYTVEGEPAVVTQRIETQGRTNFTTSNPICEGDLAGRWLWFPEGTMKYNLNSTNTMDYRNGDFIKSGWIFLNDFDPSCFNFDDSCCTNPTADPNLGYGDYDYPDCTGSNSDKLWKICFQMTTKSTTECNGENDCTIGFKTFGDGELGTYPNRKCSFDRITYLNATSVCAQPKLTASNQYIGICLGEEFKFAISANDPSMGIFWYDENGVLMTGEDNSFLVEGTPIDAGMYTYEFYATNGILSEVMFVDVEVVDELIVEYTQDPPIACKGEDVIITANVNNVSVPSDVEIQWNDNATTVAPFITIVAGEEVPALLASYVGCTSIATPYVVELHPDILPLAGEDDILTCDDSELTLGGSLSPTVINYNVEWASLEGHPIAASNSLTPTISEEGAYVMTIFDTDGGCIEADTINVTDISLDNTLTFGNVDTEIEEGQTLELSLSSTLDASQISNIEWLPSETLSCSDCLNPSANPLEDTEYNVTVTDANGCITMASILITVREKTIEPEEPVEPLEPMLEGDRVYIPNTFQPSDRPFRIFDNESIDQIISMDVFDRWGNQVYSVKNVPIDDPSATWDGRFGGRVLGQGVYIYRLHILYNSGKTDKKEGSLTLIP